MKANSLGTQLIVNNKVVGGLTSINGVEINADKIEVSALDNSTGYKEYVPDLKDVGDVTGSGFLDGGNEGQDECYTLLDSGETVPCSIVFPAKIGLTWSFNAFVTQFSTGADMGSAVSFNITMGVTGKPTLGKTPAQNNSGGEG